MDTQERTDLYRFLDAKFEGVENRIAGLQALWEVESQTCATERLDLTKRLGALEAWRGYVVGAGAVIAAILAGIPGWVAKLFAATGPK